MASSMCGKERGEYVYGLAGSCHEPTQARECYTSLHFEAQLFGSGEKRMSLLHRVGAVVLAASFFGGVCRAQAFQHPGVLVSGAQLDFVKAQVKAKAEPFYSEYQKAVASEYGALDYQLKGPPPTGIVDCGPVSHPDHGCHAEDADASAA